MNRGHRWLCRSSGWKKTLEERVLPSVVKDPDLGENVLEGGPGLTTGWLRQRLNRLTAVEIDREMEGSLASRMHGTNVRLIRDDGTALPFKEDSFLGAVAFTMFHYIPSVGLQNKLFAEICRVIRPGSVFAGVDSVDSLLMRLLHMRDTLVPIDPLTLTESFAAADFTKISVDTDGRGFRFSAICP